VFLKKVSFPTFGSYQAHSVGSNETRVRQVLGFILAKEQVGSLHLFVVNACYPKPNKKIREKPSTNGFPSTPTIIVSANARQSMSLGYLEKGTDNKMKSSNCNGSVQQNHPVRASSVCQPVEILSKVRSSKFGNENSTVKSPSKSKVNTGNFVLYFGLHPT
jgi:hypothetical protein